MAEIGGNLSDLESDNDISEITPQSAVQRREKID